MKITFITGNQGKAKEVSRYLGIPVEHLSLDLDEIQSLDLEKVVREKAMHAFRKVGKPVLVEDVSFVFHGLGKLPGTFIKWFLQELGNEGLCRLVDSKDRSCTATVCYGLHDGKEIHLFIGLMSGSIAPTPKGDGSFGWGPVFIPEGCHKTYSEMTPEEQAPIAMRNKALKKLREFLNANQTTWR